MSSTHACSGRSVDWPMLLALLCLGAPALWGSLHLPGPGGLGLALLLTAPMIALVWLRPPSRYLLLLAPVHLLLAAAVRLVSSPWLTGWSRTTREASGGSCKRPLVIAHRGLISAHPGNTLPALEAARLAGADGLEIDVTLTADDEIVLWHDDRLWGLPAILRTLGLEPHAAFRPVFPPLFHPARRAPHELDLETMRSHFGYQDLRSGRRADVILPVLPDVLAWMADRPELELLVIEVKLPHRREDLLRRFAARARTVMASSGLPRERVVFVHHHPRAASLLQEALGPGLRCTQDVHIESLWPDPDDHSGFDRAQALGSRVVSTGLPYFGFDAHRAYFEVLARDRRRLDEVGEESLLIAWVLNQESHWRSAIEVGVDAILTDDPAGLRHLIDATALPAAAHACPDG